MQKTGLAMIHLWAGTYFLNTSNKSITMLRANTLFFILLSFWIFQANAQIDAGTQERYRDFDFWIGEWEVFKFGTDTLVGISKIESILDGVVIKESYKATRGKYKGTSYNKYNGSKKRWEQYWVDNVGTTLHIVGGLIDDNMVLQNIAEQNESIRNRITWCPLPDKAVRQTWDQSKDEGVSWKTVFDGHYVSKK